MQGLAYVTHLIFCKLGSVDELWLVRQQRRLPEPKITIRLYYHLQYISETNSKLVYIVPSWLYIEQRSSIKIRETEKTGVLVRFLLVYITSSDEVSFSECVKIGVLPIINYYWI